MFIQLPRTESHRAARAAPPGDQQHLLVRRAQWLWALLAPLSHYAPCCSCSSQIITTPTAKHLTEDKSPLLPTPSSQATRNPWQDQCCACAGGTRSTPKAFPCCRSKSSFAEIKMNLLFHSLVFTPHLGQALPTLVQKPPSAKSHQWHQRCAASPCPASSPWPFPSWHIPCMDHTVGLRSLGRAWPHSLQQCSCSALVLPASAVQQPQRAQPCQWWDLRASILSPSSCHARGNAVSWRRSGAHGQQMVLVGVSSLE